MSEDPSPSFYLGLVCEGPADARTAQALVERVYTSEVEWLRDLFHSLIGWTGVESTSEYTTWSGDHGIKGLADQARIRLHGRFNGERWRGEALQATKALRLFKAKSLKQPTQHRPLVLFLIRDSDGHTERLEGLQSARTHETSPFPVVIGIAHPMRECWILASVNAEDYDEALASLRNDLGFDPTIAPHQLTAQTSTAKKNPKRVLRALLGVDDPDLERDILRTVDVDSLSTYQEVGLTDFLGEIRERIPDEIRGQRSRPAS